MPAALQYTLNLVHSIKAAQQRPLMRMVARDRMGRVGEVMKAAKIEVLHSSLKGLRHGFGVNATATGVPLNKVQKWPGHAGLKTTAIYADATGAAEDLIAERMWS